MKFLTETTLPFLDGYLDGETQSILFELLFWTILYLTFVNGGSRLLRSIYRNTRIWTLAHRREGVFCGNGRDDSILVTLTGTHHFCAGALMWFGTRTQNPILWRHGYLLEVGYELGDLLSMLIPLYPYRLDGMKKDVTVALAFHHLPGLMLSPFLMSTGLYRNLHLQAIGLWLLAGAATSCMFVMVMYTLDYSKQMGTVATLFCSNVAFFLYARWYAFPIEVLALLGDVADDPAFGEGTPNAIVYPMLKFGGFALGVFNLGICIDMVPKTYRYVKRALDGGKTPIETEPIPSSRESMLNLKAGRRSSLSVLRRSIGTIVIADPLEFEGGGGEGDRRATTNYKKTE